MPPVILLTGRPGIGKTTAVKASISLLGDKAGGFYTREVRTQSRRTGFEIVTLDGRTAWLASRSSAPIFKEEVSLGRYRVNLRGIDSIAVPALRRAVKSNRLIVIDEIGPMEIISKLFCQTVMEILDSEAPVIGTIMQGQNTFADRVRAHSRVRIRTITIENRVHVPPQVITELAQN
jgi:nucleoside-triphosphatase THEP1